MEGALAAQAAHHLLHIPSFVMIIIMDIIFPKDIAATLKEAMWTAGSS